jgi:hypothetical protein
MNYGNCPGLIEKRKARVPFLFFSMSSSTGGPLLLHCSPNGLSFDELIFFTPMIRIDGYLDLTNMMLGFGSRF